MIPLDVLKTDYFAILSIIKISKKRPYCCRGPSDRLSLLRINWVLRFGHHNYGFLNPHLRFTLRFWEENRKHGIFDVLDFWTIKTDRNRNRNRKP